MPRVIIQSSPAYFHSARRERAISRGSLRKIESRRAADARILDDAPCSAAVFPPPSPSAESPCRRVRRVRARERWPRGATRECVAAKNLRIGADLAARFAFVETKA